MTKRRSKGDGGLHWDTRRERWIATVSLGFAPDGRRLVRTASGRTKTEAKAKLQAALRDHDDGLAIEPAAYTVGEAIEDWLRYGLHGRDGATIDACANLCRTHIIPSLGVRKLRDLTADDVDRWLANKAKTLSTRTLQALRSCLNRSVRRAMARDKVKRNVVDLCSVPRGREGRPSKSLTLAQADAMLNGSRNSRMHPYIVLSLLTGARTEELRALRWDDVVLKTESDVPAHIAVWRSVRKGGDTKTKKSRRTLAIAQRCVDALIAQGSMQDRDREVAGENWREHGLVFASKVGTPLDPSHVRRDFRLAIRDVEGLNPEDWTPRELRHSFVSLLSDHGLPLEEISRLVGHSSTAITELVYRKQIRPVIQSGATAMDAIFE